MCLASDNTGYEQEEPLNLGQDSNRQRTSSALVPAEAICSTEVNPTSLALGFFKSSQMLAALVSKSKSIG